MTPAKTVFIADDSAIIRERLVALLADAPNVTVAGQAGSASEAIGGIQRLKPDIVVLDISMRGGSGLRVLEVIKKESPSPLVIMFTNLDHPLYRERCLRAGADYFLDKSNSFQRLIDIVRDFKPRSTRVPAGKRLHGRITTPSAS
ncbi:MAG: response regulator transcription factor [Verrucomicrobia subdivision 3 bacterium]|nr:response regulator transcription factor [Limisphaerales bacterium]